jgi:N-acetylglucosamine transport system permease protein
MTRRGQRLLWAIIFLTPALLLYTVFTVYPVILGMDVSFHRWAGFSPHMTWVGLGNYKAVLADSVFWGAIRNNVRLMVLPSLVTLALALFFAHSLTKGLRGEKFFRFTFFFPNVLSLVVISIFWLFIYNPKVGLFNAVLRGLGLGRWAQAWLAQDTLIPACYPPLIWMSVGFFMVLYLAAIQAIPVEIFEAAKVDGASGWQTFWMITWPLVWPMNRVVLVFFVLSGLKAFDLVYLFSYGTPILANNTMATRMYAVAFQQYNMGYGTALAVVMFVLILIATLVTLRLTRREEVTYG